MAKLKSKLAMDLDISISVDHRRQEGGGAVTYSIMPNTKLLVIGCSNADRLTDQLRRLDQHTMLWCTASSDGVANAGDQAPHQHGQCHNVREQQRPPERGHLIQNKK